MTKGVRQFTEYKRKKISILDVLANIVPYFLLFFLVSPLFLNIIRLIITIIESFKRFLNPKKKIWAKMLKKLKKVKNIELNELSINSIDKDDLLTIKEKDDIIKEEIDVGFDGGEKEEKKGFKK